LGLPNHTSQIAKKKRYIFLGVAEPYKPNSEIKTLRIFVNRVVQTSKLQAKIRKKTAIFFWGVAEPYKPNSEKKALYFFWVCRTIQAK